MCGIRRGNCCLDGITDCEQGPELMGLGESGVLWYQMLVRALIFRLVSRSELVPVFREVSEREVEVFRDALKMLKSS
jgi:hypothetical protein